MNTGAAPGEIFNWAIMLIILAAAFEDEKEVGAFSHECYSSCGIEVYLNWTSAENSMAQSYESGVT